MPPLVETVLFIFGLVALGYLVGILGYLRAEAGDGLSEYVVRIGLPLLLFRTMIAADFHGAAPLRFWGAYFCAAAVTWIVGHAMMTRLFRRDYGTAIIGGFSGAYGNIVILGSPFVLSAFGQQGFDVLSLLVSIHLPVMMAAAVVLFQFGEETSGKRRAGDLLASFLGRLAVNPLVIGILAGLAWRVTGLKLPDLPSRFVDVLSESAGPLALFGTGLGLRKFGISAHALPSIVLSALKLGLMPAVTLPFAWLFGLPPLTAKVAVAAAALPCGVNAYLLAVQFGEGEALASNATVLATAAAVVTTAFWLWIGQVAFG